MKFIDIDEIAYERSIVREPDFTAWVAMSRIPYYKDEIVQSLKNETEPTVVSTGADDVIDWRNAQALREFGTVVYIKQDRKLLLEKAKSRFPFVRYSDEKEGREPRDMSEFIFSQFESNVSLYNTIAHASIENNGTIEEGVEKLLKIVKTFP
jgi:shikimate kinase